MEKEAKRHPAEIVTAGTGQQIGLSAEHDLKLLKEYSCSLRIFCSSNSVYSSHKQKNGVCDEEIPTLLSFHLALPHADRLMIVRVAHTRQVSAPTPRVWWRRYLIDIRPAHVECHRVAGVVPVIGKYVIWEIVGSVQHCLHISPVIGRSDSSVRVSTIKHCRSVTDVVIMVALALCPGPYIGVKRQPINHVPMQSLPTNDVILLTNTYPPPHSRNPNFPPKTPLSPTQLGVAAVNCFHPTLHLDRPSA